MTLTALIIAIIGGLNWLLIGIADVNLISMLFSGNLYWIARVVYVVVGLASLWLIGYAIKKGNRLEIDR